MLMGKVNHTQAVHPYAERHMETMGQRIKTLRESRKLSQEQLGKLVGVSGATVSQWESDTTKFIRPENFLRFCAFFGVDPYWVCFGADNDPRTSTTGKFRRPSIPAR